MWLLTSGFLLAGSGPQAGQRPSEPPVARVTGRLIVGTAAQARQVGQLERVGVISVPRCFRQIPEYQRAVQAERNTARRRFLLQEANERFMQAAEQVVAEHQLVLAVEQGGLSGVPDERIVDLTEEVIARIARQEDREEAASDGSG